MNFVPAATPETTRAFEHWKQQFVRELFHRLGQPITALSCSIELALRKELSAGEYREVLEQALRLTTLLIEITNTERELLESTDPGNPRPMDIATLARSEAEDFSPLLEDREMTLFVEARAPAPILGDRERIRRVLFALLDKTLASCVDTEDLLLLVGTAGGEVFLYLGPTYSQISNGEGSIKDCPLKQSALLLGNVVRSAHGELQILRTSESVKFLLTFPLCECPEDVSAKPNFDLSE